MVWLVHGFVSLTVETPTIIEEDDEGEPEMDLSLVIEFSIIPLRVTKHGGP